MVRTLVVPVEDDMDGEPKVYLSVLSDRCLLVSFR